MDHISFLNLLNRKWVTFYALTTPIVPFFLGIANDGQQEDHPEE
jgi:hypothetical protein